MSEIEIIGERLRKISQQSDRGYREAVFSIYAHLPEGQMYTDLEKAADDLEAKDKLIAELVEALEPFARATDVINISYRVTERHLETAKAIASKALQESQS